MRAAEFLRRGRDGNQTAALPPGTLFISTVPMERGLGPAGQGHVIAQKLGLRRTDATSGQCLLSEIAQGDWDAETQIAIAWGPISL